MGLKPASGMWLYPISENSTYTFEWADGYTPDTSARSFRRMIMAGARDDRWGITSNRRRVRTGHEIIVYSSAVGASGPCLVGLATVTATPDLAMDKEWRLGLRWDLADTKRLSQAPIDATYLQERLPSQKAAVVTLSPALANWVRRAIRKVMR